MADPQAVTEKKTEDKRTDDKGTSPSLKMIRDRIAGSPGITMEELSQEPDTRRYEWQSRAPKPPPSSADFFRDLAEEQGREPISPKRAAEIEERWRFKPRNVDDPEARREAYEAYKTLLGLLSNYPPLTVPCGVILFLLAAAEGDLPAAAQETLGVMLHVSAGSISRLARAAEAGKRGSQFYTSGRRAYETLKYLSSPVLRKVGKVVLRLKKVPTTVAEWKVVARTVMDKRPTQKQLLKLAEKAIEEVDDPDMVKVLKAGKKVLEDGGTKSEAGLLVHQRLKAADRGIDFVDLGGKTARELKTSWPATQKLAGFNADTMRPHAEQTIAYWMYQFARNPEQAFTKVTVEHIFIDLEKGRAVKLVYDPFELFVSAL
jgi:hypothetical protein